jgi:hypothetical protein
MKGKLPNTRCIEEHQYDEDYKDYPKDANEEPQHGALTPCSRLIPQLHDTLPLHRLTIRAGAP